MPSRHDRRLPHWTGLVSINAGETLTARRLAVRSPARSTLGRQDVASGLEYDRTCGPAAVADEQLSQLGRCGRCIGHKSRDELTPRDVDAFVAQQRHQLVESLVDRQWPSHVRLDVRALHNTLTAGDRACRALLAAGRFHIIII